MDDLHEDARKKAASTKQTAQETMDRMDGVKALLAKLGRRGRRGDTETSTAGSRCRRSMHRLCGSSFFRGATPGAAIAHNNRGRYRQLHVATRSRGEGREKI